MLNIRCTLCCIYFLFVFIQLPVAFVMFSVHLNETVKACEGES